jgi:hypothetical protein
MVEPATGGVGSIGLLPLDLVHPTEAAHTRTDRAIREIGEWRISEKNLQLYCRMISPAFTRMAYSDGSHSVHFVERLLGITAGVSAAAIGLVNVAMQRRESIVEPKHGHPAPDFSLSGSDGRTYRLKDLAERPVVIAWFPNIWTSTKGQRRVPRRRRVARLTNLTS